VLPAKPGHQPLGAHNQSNGGLLARLALTFQSTPITRLPNRARRAGVLESTDATLTEHSRVKTATENDGIQFPRYLCAMKRQTTVAMKNSKPMPTE
jgi:hypothetical protein